MGRGKGSSHDPGNGGRPSRRRLRSSRERAVCLQTEPGDQRRRPGDYLLAVRQGEVLRGDQGPQDWRLAAVRFCRVRGHQAVRGRLLQDGQRAHRRQEDTRGLFTVGVKISLEGERQAGKKGGKKKKKKKS